MTIPPPTLRRGQHPQALPMHPRCQLCGPQAGEPCLGAGRQDRAVRCSRSPESSPGSWLCIRGSCVSSGGSRPRTPTPFHGPSQAPQLRARDGSSADNESASNSRDPKFDSWVGKIPGRRGSTLQYCWASLVVKSACRGPVGDLESILGREDLQKGTSAHSSILA